MSERSASQALPRVFCMDFTRLWSRWYVQDVLPRTEAGGRFSDWQANQSLCRSIRDQLAIEVTPEEAGRAERVLCVATEARALRNLRGWLVSMGLTEILEAGVAGKLALEARKVPAAEGQRRGSNLVEVSVGGWLFTFLYDEDDREGLEYIREPGSDEVLDYDYFDPIGEMTDEPRRTLEAAILDALSKP